MIEYNQRRVVEKAFKNGNSLKGYDLRGVNLSHMHLAGIDLSGTKLCRVDLIKSNLAGANLYGANLRDADLKQANLKGANLSKTNLSNANLYKADLTRADLTAADLTDSNLRKINIGPTTGIAMFTPVGENNRTVILNLEYDLNIIVTLGCFRGYEHEAISDIQDKYGMDSTYEKVISAMCAQVRKSLVEWEVRHD